MPLVQRRPPHGLAQHEHIRYFQDRVAPIIEELSLDLVADQPDEPAPSMIKWLLGHTKMDYASSNVMIKTSLLDEVCALQADIAALEAQKLAVEKREAASSVHKQIVAEAKAAEKLKVEEKASPEAAPEDILKTKAQAALEAAFEVFEDDEDLPVDDKDILKARAQAALEAALEDGEDLPMGDKDILKARAQAALEAALEDGDDLPMGDKDILKARAQAALEAALEDGEDLPMGDEDILKARAQAALEAALEDGGDLTMNDKDILKARAQAALEAALEDGEDRPMDDRDVLKARAQAALEAALEDGDVLPAENKDILKGKIWKIFSNQAALEAALAGDKDMPADARESLKTKAQAALEAALEDDEDLPGDAQDIVTKAQAALEAALEDGVEVPEAARDILKTKAQAALEAALEDDEEYRPGTAGRISDGEKPVSRELTNYSMGGFEDFDPEEDDEFEEEEEEEDEENVGEESEQPPAAPRPTVVSRSADAEDNSRATLGVDLASALGSIAAEPSKLQRDDTAQSIQEDLAQTGELPRRRAPRPTAVNPRLEDLGIQEDELLSALGSLAAEESAQGSAERQATDDPNREGVASGEALQVSISREATEVTSIRDFGDAPASTGSSRRSLLSTPADGADRGRLRRHRGMGPPSRSVSPRGSDQNLDGKLLGDMVLDEEANTVAAAKLDYRQHRTGQFSAESSGLGSENARG